MALKVLVVDDQPGIVQVLGIILQRAGYEPLFAINGREALEIINRERPHVVILDDMLPGEPDGGDVCLILKENHKTRHIPVIMHSAGMRIQSASFLSHIGADAALQKPCPPRRILETIEACLNERV
ncbi:MAG: response regulator [Aggregatilineales bacterium]